MNPKRTELLFGALFLGVVAVIALLFGLYPTIEIPPGAPAHTIGKIIGAMSGIACVVTGFRAIIGR